VSGSAQWQNTTHQWKRWVDLDHLAHVRQRPGDFAPGGVLDLVLEVVAYAADEAADQATGHCHITLHSDESISVADNGRGTDTRFDDMGRVIKKPVMATKDLRFFDFPNAQQLPDGHPRRGMSVVAALSEWLVHVNRRHNGSWIQRYENGVPVTGLVPVADDGTRGTTVHFLADEALRTAGHVSPRHLLQVTAMWRQLAIDLNNDVSGRP
jgi:topoisomerase-4 subunit B